MTDEQRVLALSKTIIELNHAIRVGREANEAPKVIASYVNARREAHNKLSKLLDPEDPRFFVTIDRVRHLGRYNQGSNTVSFWEFDEISTYGEPIPGMSD